MRPRAARSEVSGVRSSCETVEMNSSFMRSRARRSVVSVNATTTPTALPLGLASGASGLGSRLRDRGLDLWAGDVFDREAGAVLAPEDFVRDANGVEIVEGVLDGALFGRVGAAVGAGVMDEVVHVAAENLLGFEAEHLRGRRD